MIVALSVLLCIGVLSFIGLATLGFENCPGNSASEAANRMTNFLMCESKTLWTLLRVDSDIMRLKKTCRRKQRQCNELSPYAYSTSDI